MEEQHKFGAMGGIVTDTFMGTVDGKRICTHMHRTRKGAIRCAKSWQRFQDKVENLKKHPPQYIY